MSSLMPVQPQDVVRGQYDGYRGEKIGRAHV